MGTHTHQRLDRDSHVYINWGNIEDIEDHSHYEKCYGRWNCETWGYPYDCDSIMHYGKDQMSINGEDTIGKSFF